MFLKKGQHFAESEYFNEDGHYKFTLEFEGPSV